MDESLTVTFGELGVVTTKLVRKARSAMSLAGTGVVAIWHDLLPEAKDDFYEWHNREHMPERVGIPGFRRGRRYIAVEGTPEFFNLYEADSPEVLGGPGLPRSPQRADGMDEARRAVVPQRGALDLPRGVHERRGQRRHDADDALRHRRRASRGRDRSADRASPAVARVAQRASPECTSVSPTSRSARSKLRRKKRAPTRRWCRRGSC